MAREKAEIFMPLYLADYDRDTSDLSFEEHGFYMAILRALWSKGGTLPTDHDRLARVLRTDVATLRRLWPTVSRFLTVTGEMFTQGRLYRELEKALGKVRAAAKNGRIGGANRAKRLANGKQTGSDPTIPLEANGKQNCSSSHTELDLSLSLADPVLEAGSDRDLETRAIPRAGGTAQMTAHGLMAIWGRARVQEFGGHPFDTNGFGIKSDRQRDGSDLVNAIPGAVDHVEASMRKFWRAVKSGDLDNAAKAAQTPSWAWACWMSSFPGDFEQATGVAPEIKQPAARASPRTATADAFAKIQVRNRGTKP